MESESIVLGGHFLSATGSFFFYETYYIRYKNDTIHLGKRVDNTALQLRLEMHLQRNELVEAIQALATLSDKRHNEVMDRLDKLTCIVMQMHDELVSVNANYKGHDQRIDRLEGAVFPQSV